MTPTIYELAREHFQHDHQPTCVVNIQEEDFSGIMWFAFYTHPFKPEALTNPRHQAHLAISVCTMAHDYAIQCARQAGL
jgi:hypothetical protein